MKLAIVVTEQNILLGGKDQPLDLYQKIDFLPSISEAFSQLLVEVNRYALAEIYVFFHVSDFHYQIFPFLENLRPWERKKALNFQMSTFRKNIDFWGCVENANAPTVGFTLEGSPVLHELIEFLNKASPPIVGIYPLTLAICKKAYDELVHQVSEIGEWNIIFINMENTLPTVVLMKGYMPVEVKKIQDAQLIEKEINELFTSAQKQTSTPPAFVVYGTSPQLSEVLPWQAYMTFPSQASPFDLMGMIKPMHTPFETQRKWWRLRQKSQIMSLILTLTLGLFFIGSYFFELRLHAQQAYFNEKSPVYGEVHLPQGFYAQKAIVMLDDYVQRLPWHDLWTCLGPLMPQLPPLHAVRFELLEGEVQAHLTLEAPEDMDQMKKDLKEAFHADSVTLSQVPPIMDVQKSYTTHSSDDGPHLLTVTLSKGL